MARYLIVKIEDNAEVGPVRKALHGFASVSDFGLAPASGVTSSEARTVITIFEAVMRRAKAAHKANEEERAMTPDGYKWSSGLLEDHRHLVRLYQADALCAAVQEGARIGNTNKEKCTDCLALSEALT